MTTFTDQSPRPKPPVGETFRDKACAHFGIPTERYNEIVLQRVLYPHARWLGLFPASTWLAPDRCFLAEAGRLTRARGLRDVARDYQDDLKNRRFGRRVLRLRASVERMRELFSEVWGESMPAEAPQNAMALSTSSPEASLTD